MDDTGVRVYLDQPLAPGQPLDLGEGAANYLFSVMRLGVGAGLRVFNGRDGEWLARVEVAGRRAGRLVAEVQTAPQLAPPDLWLLFAPLKKARTDFLVEKAVELGVARLVPVQTRRTNAERVRADRLRAHAVEAAEQCGATVVPEVAELAPLDRVLAAWPAGRRLFFCDEGAAGRPAGLPEGTGGPAAVLIGPEGGFAPEERARLAALPGAVTLSLGPRILRAETAAVAALTLWQARHGDWQGRARAP
jgi:16S rRNA (uracil1498-N3)-methyltransferase